MTEELLLNKPHPSFTRNNYVSGRIKFEVTLMPNCLSHVLTFSLQGFSSDKNNNDKRTHSRVMYDENLEKGRLSGKKHKLDVVTDRVDSEKISPNKMNESEACERILRALPDAKSIDGDTKEVTNDDYLAEPIGTTLQHYIVNLGGAETEFEIKNDQK